VVDIADPIDRHENIDDQQTLKKSDTNNRIPLITIPINIGENILTVFCPLNHRGSVQHSFIHHPSKPNVT